MEAVAEIQTESPLIKLVEKLKIQRAFQKDLVVPSGYIRYDGFQGLLNVDGEEYGMCDLSHDQMASKLNIPYPYYKRMRHEYPELLAQNVNMWMSRKENVKYLLRTFKFSDEGTQNICRAVLSDRYNIIDNFDVLITSLQALKETGVHVEITKAVVSERKMHLHIVCPEIMQEANELLENYLRHKDVKNVGNGIIAGLSISNSDVGCGSFECVSRAVILKCNNGMIDKNAQFRRVHLGARLDEGGIEWNEDVKQKNYGLILAQTKQAVQTFLSKDHLGQQVKKLEEAHGMEVKHPTGIIEHVARELNIPVEQKDAILDFFIKDGDLTGSGVFNAMTRHAQTLAIDDQYEMEVAAFNVLPLLRKFDKPASNN